MARRLTRAERKLVGLPGVTVKKARPKPVGKAITRTGRRHKVSFAPKPRVVRSRHPRGKSVGRAVTKTQKTHDRKVRVKAKHKVGSAISTADARAYFGADHDFGQSQVKLPHHSLLDKITSKGKHLILDVAGQSTGGSIPGVDQPKPIGGKIVKLAGKKIAMEGGIPGVDEGGRPKFVGKVHHAILREAGKPVHAYSPVLDEGVNKELRGQGKIAKDVHKVAEKLSGKPDKHGVKHAAFPGAALLGETLDIATQLPASVVIPAEAGIQAAAGKPAKLRALKKQLTEHDPVLLLAQGRTKEALKEAKQHPVGTALEVSGTASGASRGAGRTLRMAPKGSSLERLGSRERAPAIAPGTGQKHVRHYSPGVVGKATQVGVEKVRVKRATKQYRKAQRAHDQGAEAEVVKRHIDKGDKRNPLRVTPSKLGKRLNERVALAEGRRRIHRAVGEHQVVEALSRKHGGLALLLGRGIVKPTEESVRGYLSQVEGELGRKTGGESALGPAERASAKALVKHLRKALDDKKLDLPALHEEGKAYAKVMGERQSGLTERGIISQEGVDMATMVPAGKQHVGIKYEEGRALTPIGERLTVTARQRAKALAQVRDAQELVRVAPHKGPAHAALAKAKADLVKAEKAHVAAKKAHQGRPVVASTRFVGPSGERVTAPMLAQRLKAKGIDPKELGFFSQHPDANSPGAFFTNWSNGPRGLSKARLTGEATTKGTFSADRDVARASVARAQGLIDAHDEYAGFLGENGLKENGELFRGTKREVDKKIRDLAAQRLENPGRLTAATYGWRAVPLKPQFGKTGQMEELVGRAGKDASPIQEGIKSALKGEGDSRGEWALVPEKVADQLSQHTKVIDPTVGGKAWRQANRVFRGAVLATSPTWLTGNTVEAGLRSLVSKTGPESYKLGRDILSYMQKNDPKLAEEMLVRLGAGHFGMQELQAIHTTTEMFQDTLFAPVAQAMGTFLRTPGVKHAAKAWNAYTHFVFTKNGLLEHQFKVGMLGRYAQDFLMDHNAAFSWEKAIAQAAHGLKNTDEQAAAAAWTRRAYGRYEAFGPSGRRFIQQYTPFVAWTLNAYQFLFSVLPRDHPALLGLGSMAYQATEPQRNASGRGQGAPGHVPDWLQGTLAVKGGSRPLARYTPAGAASDPIGTIGSALLPQVSSAYMASQGLDWTGKPLAKKFSVNQVTDSDKTKGVLNALFHSSVPGLGLATSIKKYGAQGVNPFRKIPKVKPKSGGGGGGGNSSGSTFGSGSGSGSTFGNGAGSGATF